MGAGRGGIGRTAVHLPTEPAVVLQVFAVAECTVCVDDRNLCMQCPACSFLYVGQLPVYLPSLLFSDRSPGSDFHIWVHCSIMADSARQGLHDV